MLRISTQNKKFGAQYFCLNGFGEAFKWCTYANVLQKSFKIPFLLRMGRGGGYSLELCTVYFFGGGTWDLVLDQ